MLIVMKSRATPAQIDDVVAAVRKLGLTPHVLPGAARTAIGVTGNDMALSKSAFEMLPGVDEALRVTKPYKLASREMKADDTVIKVQKTSISSKTFTVIAGPCSIDTEANLQATAEFLLKQGVTLLRAGAFKPRSSPYSFQGLGLDGLEILRAVKKKTGIGIVTEVMDVDHVAPIEDVADILQIGARNMQNFSLLKRVSQCKKPVLLKRGLSATLEEWLMAAEYILAGGNSQVILCERGIRTFNTHSRNTLDLGVIPAAKALTHLPILVDPSHGTGKRSYVSSMSMAALAAGADGLLIEVHPDPDHAASDALQTLNFDEFGKLNATIKTLAPHFERTFS